MKLAHSTQYILTVKPLDFLGSTKALADKCGQTLYIGDYVRNNRIFQIVMVHNVPYLREIGKSENSLEPINPDENGRIGYVFCNLEHEAE